MKKASPDDAKTNLIQLCGGLGIQVKKTRTYPEMKFSDILRGWLETWFYCKDIPTSGSITSLPPFSSECLQKPSKNNLRLTKAEKLDVDIMVP